MDFNREYKSTIFSLLFSDPNNLLSLYNALNGTDYKDPEGLTVNTLKEGGIFMKYRNDISFVFNSHLTLVEHQSTANPNMPLRDLFYVSDILKNMVDRKAIYKTTLVRIPFPQFVVVYNGKKDMPLQSTLKLSDAFETGDETRDSVSPELELYVTVFNINSEKHSPLLDKCKPLFDYAELIRCLTEATSQYTDDAKRTAAAEAVIDQCIKEGLLRDFLLKHRLEVVRMYFWEYDEELANAAHQEELDEIREKLEVTAQERDAALQKIEELSKKLAAYEAAK